MRPFHALILSAGLFSTVVLGAPVEPVTIPQCDTAFNFSLPKANPLLPSPFTFLSGQNVSSKAQWSCRRDEIGQLFQQYELGYLPADPESLSSTFTSPNLTINAGNQGKNISWTVQIKYPNGTAPQGGWPAMITYGPASIPIPSTVANIVFDNSAFAVQNNASNRGTGIYYDLYGTNATTGALMAWSWGVSRIIDVLEKNSATIGINAAKVGITGCSRNGKGALVAGAFEPRLALTIPQESGSGGAACWRLSDDEQKQGNVVQTLSEIVTENVWYATELAEFVNQTALLPLDHHMLIGLVAPRGLLAIDNTAYEWLTPQSSYGCEVAGRLVYQALGVSDHMGHSQVGDHQHCMFPSDQQPQLDAFIGKFLLGDNSTNTDVTDTNYGVFDQTKWINWPVPNISS